MSKKDLNRWYQREIKKDEREISFNKQKFIKEIKNMSRKELIDKIKGPKKISKWKKIIDKVKSFFRN